MPPAHERLEAAQAAVFERDDGLVEDHEFAVPDRAAQVVFQVQAARRLDQKLVPSRVAEAVVNDLEPVEVEEEDREEDERKDVEEKCFLAMREQSQIPKEQPQGLARQEERAADDDDIRRGREQPFGVARGVTDRRKDGDHNPGVNAAEERGEKDKGA